MGNRLHGIHLRDARDNRIGGDSDMDGNMVLCNGGDGINVSGSGATHNEIQGNLIGTDQLGCAGPGNDGSGVAIDGASFNVVGSLLSGLQDGDGQAGISSGNVIVENCGNGVTVRGKDAVGNAILSNEFEMNGGLSIDLGDDGITENGVPGREGPNHLQSWPELGPYTLGWGNQLMVPVVLDGVAGRRYELQFYEALEAWEPEEDAQGLRHGEGWRLLDSVSVEWQQRAFEVTIDRRWARRPVEGLSEHRHARITATATSVSSRRGEVHLETSELGNNIGRDGMP